MQATGLSSSSHIVVGRGFLSIFVLVQPTCSFSLRRVLHYPSQAHYDAAQLHRRAGLPILDEKLAHEEVIVFEQAFSVESFPLALCMAQTIVLAAFSCSKPSGFNNQCKCPRAVVGVG